MNIFVPQSIQTQIELEELADVKLQIITPTTSRTIIGIVQDGLLGAYNLTAPNVKIDWRNAMNIMSYTSMEKFDKFEKNKTYTGQELFSLIIPPAINATTENLKIKSGVIQEGGRLTKDELGSKKGSAIHQLIWDEYGAEETKQFIDDTQRLINNFNLYNGFTVGYGDTQIPNVVKEQIYKLFETKEQKVCHMITEIENNPNLMESNVFEFKLKEELLSIRENVGKLIMANLSPENNFNIMILSGSRGDSVNMAQICGCLGLQAVEGKMIQKKYNDRTSPYFHQNDDRGESRGLVRSSFYDGLSFNEFVFLLMAGREGLIDQAIKSVTGDTPIIIIENDTPKRVQIGDWIDQLLEKSKSNVKHYKERDMELLDVNEIYIPSTDEDGNVKWCEIKAITRHDPGMQLYEIKTKGGRSVIVTESKSLLIWNSKTNKFEHTSTPKVKLGDYVPVTMKLEEFKNKMSDEFVIEQLGTYVSSNGVIDEDCIRIICETDSESDDISMLCSRLGIFTEIDKHELIIRGQWAKIFASKITLLDDNKNNKLSNMIPSKLHKNFKSVNDVVLDEIVEINLVDVKKYPKVYDLTVPDTLNFGLANGLHVVDTAQTGYTQRRLVKSMEDIIIAYDGTVRTANGTLLQVTYGDSGANTTKQFSYKVRLVEMSNKDLEERHKFDSEQIKKYKQYKKNDEVYDMIKNMRNSIRKDMAKAKGQNITLTNVFMLPVNIDRIINNTLGDKKSDDDVVDPTYVHDKLEEILTNEHTMLIPMRKKERENKKSIKNRDEQIVKTLFKTALYDSLSPKRSVVEYKFSKKQFDKVIDEITNNYNKNIVEAGEMVGIIGAQSLGEPTTQLTLKSFHSSGIATMSTKTQGVPRILELFSVTKKPKTPQLYIYLTPEFKQSKEMAHRIASYIKYTTLGELRGRIEIYYDPKPNEDSGIMKKDGVKNVFYNQKVMAAKSGCQGDIANLPWLMRIEIEREKMLEKEVTLLDIKTKFCNWWEKRFGDSKNMKKEERKVINKITSLAVLSNSDSDKQPVIHLRFNVKDTDKIKDPFNRETLNNFIDHVIDKFKLKGIEEITNIAGIVEQRRMVFDDKTGDTKNINEQLIITEGVNLKEIRYIIGIDALNTICNDIYAVYQTYGIEIARARLLREIATTYEEAGGGNINYQHLSILVDMMTSGGYLMSVDRHGMNKSDTDPLSKASFEKSVEQLLTASVFGEVDHMKGVSSRLMAGLVIKGGTGMCDVLLNTSKIEKMEYTEEGDVYKQFTEINTNTLASNIVNKEHDDIFIPL